MMMKPRYLGATEIADGIDNDYDTNIDEGTPFFDDDGDVTVKVYLLWFYQPVCGGSIG